MKQLSLKLLFVSCYFLLQLSTAQSQHIDINISPLSFCRTPTGEASVPVVVTVDMGSLPAAGAPYHFNIYKTGTTAPVAQNVPAAASTTVTLTPDGDRTYYATIFNKDDIKLGTNSKNVSITVFRTPDPIAEDNPFGTTIILNTTDVPYGLNQILADPPSWVDISFQGIGTAVPAVEQVGTSSNYQFNPSKVPPGTYQVQYTASEDNNCSIVRTVQNTSFIVIDAQASLPLFLKTLDPLPICENLPSFSMLAYINKFCFDPFFGSPSVPSTIPIRLTYKTGVTTVTGTYIGSDGSSAASNAIYSFTFTPSLHIDNVYSILIEIIPPFCPSNYRGYIPLFPRRNPLLIGLPPVVNDEDINICSASYDTLFMRGNPGGGSYNYYQGVPNGGGYTYTKINGSISPYNPPADEPSLQKFVPANVFKDFADSVIDNVIKVVYTYPANGSGSCPDSITRIFKFTPAVATTFEKPTITPYCYGDTLVLTVINSNPGDQFSWSFGNGYSIPFNENTVTRHFYNAPGKYGIRFKTSIASLPPGTCNNDVIDSVMIGAQPSADFDVFKNFKDSATVFKSIADIAVDNISNRIDDMDTIVTWHWSFGTPSSDTHLSTIKGDTVFTYTNVQKDPYQITHTVTAKWGCQATSTRYIPIFPVKTVTSGNFVLDTFSLGDVNGWYESGQYKNKDTTSSWQNILPNGNTIQEYPDGAEAWITSENKGSASAGYYDNENSWVESPAFDIRLLDLPMVSLNTWVNSDNLFDGASVQYAFCDNVAFGKEKWYTLGNVNTGLEWYNSNTVIGKPGNNLKGWTGTSSDDWKFSAYILDEPKDSLAPKNYKLMRFRVVLGTNNDNTPGVKFDGFAFDNFFVGERNRKVLVEEFCDYEFNEVDLDSSFKDPQAIRIQYHLRTHNSDDEINNQNKAEPSARALLYGVGKELPRGVIDGVLTNNDLPLKNWGLDDFYQRLLIISPFNIKLSYQVTGGKLFITDSIVKVDGIPIQDPLVAQIAVVERNVYAHNDTFTNVLRNMLPTSAGTRIDKTYDWSIDKEIKQTWSPFAKPKSELLIISFIQNENTKEIYQTNYISVDSTTAANLTLVTPRGFSGGASNVSFSEVVVSPNPTASDLTVHFNGILNENYTYTITDGLGNHIRTSKLEGNASASVLSTSDLHSGIYYIMFEGEGQRIVKKFAVVK